MHRRTVTLADVAAAAGVSKMTVSNVLSTKQASHRHVSPQTRERVLAAVRSMKYSPNANASALRRRRTNIIGIYTGYGNFNAENPFRATILGGLQEGCDQHRKDLLIHGTFPSRSVDDVYIELMNGRIDGLILYSTTNDPLAELLADSLLPVVAITDAVPTLPSVVVDDVMGSRLIVDYLVAKGHRHIVYHSCTRSYVSVIRRLDACLEACAASGIQMTIYPTPHAMNGPHMTDEAASWLEMPADRRPTAAVCWNDLTAYDLLEQCEQRGIRVPEEVAIIGFDNILSSRRGLYRRLTTVHAPWAEAARTALELLVKQIEGDQIAQETVLPVELVIGDTA